MYIHTTVLQPAVATSSRLATLEMRELNERQRADLATARNTQLRDSLVQLEQRNTELEGKFASLTERLLLSQNRETDLMEKMAGTVHILIMCRCIILLYMLIFESCTVNSNKSLF